MATRGNPKPRFAYTIDVAAERKRLRQQKAGRGIPDRDSEHVLMATWNVANLGADGQRRDPECFEVLAEVVSWFDLVAVQEVRDDVDSGIRELRDRLPSSWRLLFSEAGGNDERFAFLWDSETVDAGQLVGKVTFEPHELRYVGGTGSGFTAFSRTPYIATFHRGDLALEVVSVHSIFGNASDPIDMGRRLAETKAIAYWCGSRSKDPDSYTKDIIAVGDFNTPSEDDLELATEMLKSLRAKGLHTPRYGSEDENLLETVLGTAVRSENHYDHLLFFPEHTDADLVQTGVFDFDAVIFADLYEGRSEDDWERYVIWAISDHRPLWAQLRA